MFQSPADVALSLLDGVDEALLPSFITKYLSSYVLDHKLERDEIISQYIMVRLIMNHNYYLVIIRKVTEATFFSLVDS